MKIVPNLQEARREAIQFGTKLKDAGSTEAVKKTLSAKGGNNLQDERTHLRLRDRLLADISAAKPFSAIRLGDGEGNMLFWGIHKDDYPSLARHCMDKIWIIMFGANRPRDENWDDLYDALCAAVLNADYLGLPTLSQHGQCVMALSQPPERGFDIRGKAGVASVWHWFETIGRHKLTDTTTVITNCHVHISFLQFYDALARAAGNLSLITCFPSLLDLLHKKCGVATGETILIPPQAVNIKGTPNDIHFPERYMEIDRQLDSRNLNGRLFFVGAGLAGKPYCDRIKRQGGMAIDVGSLMDVWMGYGVRLYQSAEFVNRHQLSDSHAE